ncbi:MAG: ATP phosphoribosyltransferase [Nitrososphaerales archaeon]
MVKVKLALPKGSLEKDTLKLFERAWYKVYGADRSYRPLLSDEDIEVKLLRPQEIPLFVAYGLQDVGITGEDWIRETNADVKTLLNLEYGKVRLVLALPILFNVNTLSELINKFYKENKILRISSEYLKIPSSYIMNNEAYKRIFGDKEPLTITPWWRKGENDRVRIYLSFGATEAKPPEDADAIVDVTETGTTLEKNNLKAIEVLMESSAVLIANKDSIRDENKREKIYDIVTLLKGVIESDKKLHIFLNVKEENLEELLEQLPALKRPTISPLSEKGWYAINTIIDKKSFLKLLPTLRRLAQGLVVHEPQQILPLEEISRNEKEE